MDTSKGSEKVNDDGSVEIKVDTVNYRTRPGQEAEPEKEKVEVTHLIRDDDDKDKSVVAKAADKVAGGLQSAKEAVSGEKKKE